MKQKKGKKAKSMGGGIGKTGTQTKKTETITATLSAGQLIIIKYRVKRAAAGGNATLRVCRLDGRRRRRVWHSYFL